MARDGGRRAPRSRVPEARAANPIWKSCDCRLRGPDRRCHRPVTVPAVARGEAHRYTSRELTETRDVDLMINHHVALIYAMVVGAAADGALADSELETIRDIVQHLPIFDDFAHGNLAPIASAATELLTVDDGLAAVISQSTEARRVGKAWVSQCRSRWTPLY